MCDEVNCVLDSCWPTALKWKMVVWCETNSEIFGH